VRALAPQGGAMKKGYHKMPDGKMMKDSAHKGMKKMAKGGSVKKGQELENERKAEDKSKAPKFKKGGSVKAKL
jgi:hypothetical protein